MPKQIINIKVFTDGSSLDNASKVSYGGIGIYFPNKELDDISEHFLIRPVTNQRAELYAIYTALDKITNGVKFDTITIYTDSDYSIKSLTVWINNWKKNGWKGSSGKPVKNRDIIEPIHEIMQKYPNQIKFIHVRSHTGKKDFDSVGNDKADKLAVAGAVQGKNAINRILEKNNRSKPKIHVNTDIDLDDYDIEDFSYMENEIKDSKIKVDLNDDVKIKKKNLKKRRRIKIET